MSASVNVFEYHSSNVVSANSHTYIPARTQELSEIIWYSIIHSLFHSRLKTFLFCKSFPPQPFLFLLMDSLHGFPRLFTVISEHICFLLLVFLFLHLLVVGSVR